MSEQALGVGKSLQVVRRHWAIVGIVALLGLLAGGGYAALNPPMLTSAALVVLPSATRDGATQAVVAGSDPVLSGALRSIRPGMSLQALRSRVQVKRLTSNVISISAQGKTPAQAEGSANAVAASYLAFVSAGPGVQTKARLLEPATNATAAPLPVDLLVTGGLGALLGGLIGAIGALALGLSDRRLRERDAMANAIGAPVLASIPVDHPADAGRWTRLLENYQPSAVHAWQLRTSLHYLGQPEAASAAVSDPEGISVAVLSLSSDKRALALGPQLAAFAASLGIPTVLVVGPQQEMKAAAALRAACAASPSRSNQLRVAVAGPDDLAWRQPAAKLTVIVAVVSSQVPRVADTMGASTTVLGVSAGAATAEQLAAVAASAAADGHQIDGILVADPDPADRTTGRVPQLARPAQRSMPTRPASMPTHVSGMAAKTDPVGFVGAWTGEPAESGGEGEPAASLPVAPAEPGREEPAASLLAAPAESGGEDDSALSLPTPSADCVPLGVPVTAAQAEHRAARWWPGVVAAAKLTADDTIAVGPLPPAGPARSGGTGRRRWLRWPVALVLVWGALAVADIAVFHSSLGASQLRTSHPVAGGAAAHRHARATVPITAAAGAPAGDARDRAATWIAQQVSRGTVMGCDVAMCAMLRAHGIAAANLIELGPGGASDPLGTGIVVATAAVRSEFGSRLSGVYAPVVVASFGSGSAAIQIRVTAPDGTAAYLRELHSDLLARRMAGAQLLHSTHLTAAPAARQALADGDVDTRLLKVIAALAGSHRIVVASFGGSEPGASSAVPLRSADIAMAPGARSGDESLSSLFAFLHAQEPPYLPASVTKTRLATGQPAIRVQFGDPSPLGLLASTGAAPEIAKARTGK